MPRRQSIGQIRAEYIPGEDAIADITAPTVTELGAVGAMNLTRWMRRDGLTTPRSANAADASDASSLDNLQSTGTRDQGPLTVVLYRDSDVDEDDPWESLDEDSYGFLVVRRFGGSATAFAQGDRVEVYPVQVGTTEMAQIGENENQRFTASLMVHRPSELRATVAPAA